MIELVFKEMRDGTYRVSEAGRLVYTVARDPQTRMWTALDSEGVQVIQPNQYRYDLFARLEIHHRDLNGGSGQPTSQFVGYVPDNELPLGPGDVIRIPAGIRVNRPTAPDSMSKNFLTQRAQVVEVNHVLNGSNETSIRNPKPLSNPKVVWAGAGGYWCEVLFSDLEIAGVLPIKEES